MKYSIHELPYLPALQNWQRKWGPKPTAENLQLAHHIVSVRGGKHAIGTALAMRDCGVHDWQLKQVTQAVKYVGGSDQTLHSYRDRVCKAGYFELTGNKKSPVDDTLPFGSDNTWWQMKVTAKGTAEFKRHLAAGSVEAAFQRKAAAVMVTLEAAAAAKAAAAKAKAKATREAKKAAKANLAAHANTPNTVTMPHTIDEAMAVDTEQTNN